MDKKYKYRLLIFFLILILFAIDYPLLDKALTNLLVDYEIGIVERVIDGDTVVVNGSNVRLLGINTPEKGGQYYSEAKSYLENQTLHKLVKMERGKDDKDLYGRKLRYISIGGKNVNREIIENGYANFYFPSGKDKHYNDYKEAWKNCVISGENLCAKSQNKCAECIFIKNIDLKNQKIVLANRCSFSCSLTNWEIKDEGRKSLLFSNFSLEKEVEIEVGEGNNTKDKIFWTGEEYVWTQSGDTVLLRDNEGKLVLWWSY